VIEKTKSAAAAQGAISASAATIDILRKMFILVMPESPDRSGPRAPVVGLSVRPKASISQMPGRSPS
jgi:hypothetical protein